MILSFENQTIYGVFEILGRSESLTQSGDIVYVRLLI